MSLIRVGSTSKYADGWAAVFGGAAGKKAGGKKAKPAKKAVAAAKKKSASLKKQVATKPKKKAGRSRHGPREGTRPAEIVGAISRGGCGRLSSSAS